MIMERSVLLTIPANLMPQSYVVSNNLDDSTSDRTPHRPIAPHPDDDTAQELRKTNELLGQLVQQMKNTEQRVKALEERGAMSSCSSSSSNSRGKREKKIPIAVKVSR